MGVSEILNNYTIPIVLLVLAVKLGFLVMSIRNSSSDASSDKDLKRLKQIHDRYDLKIRQKDEVPVKIKALYYYPCRGIRGIETDALEID